jgi:nitrous oxide reductase accessory protein NosL
MGMNLTAFQDEESAIDFINHNSGEIYNWKEISKINLEK